MIGFEAPTPYPLHRPRLAGVIFAPQTGAHG
jgi:hypothetical protein